MTDTTRERQRIVAIIEDLKAQSIRTYSSDFAPPDAAIGLALIGQYQKIIDKIMEATDE